MKIDYQTKLLIEEHARREREVKKSMDKEVCKSNYPLPSQEKHRVSWTKATVVE